MVVDEAFTLKLPDGLDHRWLFAESPSVVVASVPAEHLDAVERAAAEAGVPLRGLGTAGGDRLTAPGLLDLTVADVAAAWKGRLPDALGWGSTH